MNIQGQCLMQVTWSILQYCRPALRYHLSLRPLFCLILSGRLKPVLLYAIYLAVALFIAMYVLLRV